MKPNIAARLTKDQVSANRSGIGHAASFAGHREHMTREILARSPADGAGRLCLLGAGNAYDVDLGLLAERFAEIHLVDIDPQAVARARDGAPEAVRGRLHLHAPFDVSGIWAQTEDLAREGANEQRLGAEIGPAVRRVVEALPGPFDVVVSCCMLTQLQLAVLDALSDRHPAFNGFRGLTNAVHVRVLVALMAEGGRALLFTDLTSDETYPFESLEPGADLGKVMGDLMATGNVIHTAHPGLLSAEVRHDPGLAAVLDVRFPVGPWLWNNGPSRTFLVYGLEFSHKSRAPAAIEAAPAAPPPPSQTAVPAEAPGSASAGPAPVIRLFDDVIPRSYQDLIKTQTDGLAWTFQPEDGGAPFAFRRRFADFAHVAYDVSASRPVSSALYALLGPLLFMGADRAGLPITGVLSIRLGLLPETELDVPHHNPRVDLPEPHMVGLYYVNDSDGDTVIFRETYDDVPVADSAAHANGGRFREAARVSPRQGRMVFFDGRRYHAEMHPRRHTSRVVVKFVFR